jgi:hypothetical protein
MYKISDIVINLLNCQNLYNFFSKSDTEANLHKVSNCTHHRLLRSIRLNFYIGIVIKTELVISRNIPDVPASKILLEISSSNDKISHW